MIDSEGAAPFDESDLDDSDEVKIRRRIEGTIETHRRPNHTHRMTGADTPWDYFELPDWCCDLTGYDGYTMAISEIIAFRAENSDYYGHGKWTLERLKCPE